MSYVEWIDGVFLGIVRRVAHAVERVTGASSFVLGRPLLAFYIVAMWAHASQSGIFDRIASVIMTFVSWHDYRQTYKAEQSSLTDTPAKARFLVNLPSVIRVPIWIMYTPLMPFIVYATAVAIWTADLREAAGGASTMIYLAVVYLFDVDPKRPARSLIQVMRDKLALSRAKPVSVNG